VFIVLGFTTLHFTFTQLTTQTAQFPSVEPSSVLAEMKLKTQAQEMHSWQNNKVTIRRTFSKLFS